MPCAASGASSAQAALVAELPAAAGRTLEGQTHMVKPAVLAAALAAFLAGRPGARGRVTR
jgi:hypothetical protein